MDCTYIGSCQQKDVMTEYRTKLPKQPTSQETKDWYSKYSNGWIALQLQAAESASDTACWQSDGQTVNGITVEKPQRADSVTQKVWHDV